ncbi:hypothetical protein DFQ28_008892 [Apophysomyces sp. BC1034]|nr:hypothetical protein DFQ30_005222 [Apophysomyces sp. BC1015]KAG0183403.1 hypothetical protein DFQ29_005779 [Apophysomyces sp. BC1021]KAG0194633.1 hypothetical protein DFQ28_008892 [Apophysomyces sp. BC1034]
MSAAAQHSSEVLAQSIVQDFISLLDGIEATADLWEDVMGLDVHKHLPAWENTRNSVVAKTSWLKMAWLGGKHHLFAADMTCTKYAVDRCQLGVVGDLFGGDSAFGQFDVKPIPAPHKRWERFPGDVPAVKEVESHCPESTELDVVVPDAGSVIVTASRVCLDLVQESSQRRAPAVAFAFEVKDKKIGQHQRSGRFPAK